MKGTSGLLSQKNKKILVTGGGGHSGFFLGCGLVKLDNTVILLDIKPPRWTIPKGATFISADVTNYNAVFKAAEGVDGVFHLASYGTTGAASLDKEKNESVNVGGTQVVIDVCRQRNIPWLIYISSIDVVFPGKPVYNGDEETLPYLPPEKYYDQYARTKSIAEQRILAANGTALQGGGILRTCALRPAGIYGPDERKIIGRMTDMITHGFAVFKFGDPHAKMNWVNIENLIQSFILAVDGLTAEKNHIASGQSYFVHDGEDVHLYEWMAPLFHKLGYKLPWLRIPVCLVYLTASVMEFLYFALKPFYDFVPLVTRIEVLKTSVNETYSISKARTELGYCPKKYNFADCVDNFLKNRVPEGQKPSE